MIRRKKVWILIADGTRARIFVKKYKKLQGAVGQDFISSNLPDRKMHRSKPGRAFESTIPMRYSYEPRPD